MIAKLLLATILFQPKLIVFSSRPEVEDESEFAAQDESEHAAPAPTILHRISDNLEKHFCRTFSRPACVQTCHAGVCDLSSEHGERSPDCPAVPTQPECESMCDAIDHCFNDENDKCDKLVQKYQEWWHTMMGGASEPKALWSGGIGTSMYARKKGHRTLESNPVAQTVMAVMEECKEFGSDGQVPLDVWQNNYARLFDAMSVKFVQEMQNDELHVYFTDIDETKTLMAKELPQVASNPNIKKVVFHRLVSKDTGKQVEGLANSPDNIKEQDEECTVALNPQEDATKIKQVAMNLNSGLKCT